MLNWTSKSRRCHVNLRIQRTRYRRWYLKCLCVLFVTLHYQKIDTQHDVNKYNHLLSSPLEYLRFFFNKINSLTNQCFDKQVRLFAMPCNLFAVGTERPYSQCSWWQRWIVISMTCFSRLWYVFYRYISLNTLFIYFFLQKLKDRHGVSVYNHWKHCLYCAFGVRQTLFFRLQLCFLGSKVVFPLKFPLGF